MHDPQQHGVQFQKPVKTGFLAALGVGGGLATVSLIIVGVVALVLFCVLAALCGGCMMLGSSLEKSGQRYEKLMEEARQEQARQQEATGQPTTNAPLVP